MAIAYNVIDFYTLLYYFIFYFLLYSDRCYLGLPVSSVILTVFQFSDTVECHGTNKFDSKHF